MAANKTPITPIYEVRVEYDNWRLCRTPQAAAEFIFNKGFSPSEKKAISIPVLVKVIEGIRAHKQINLYGMRVERKQLYG